MVADAIVTAVVTEEDEKSLGGDSIPIIQMGLLLSIVFYGVVTFLHHYWHHYQQVWKMTHFLSSKLMILNFITTQILEKIGEIHTILKFKILSKNSILTKPQHFHEFFTQIFFDNFSREIKVVNS